MAYKQKSGSPFLRNFGVGSSPAKHTGKIVYEEKPDSPKSPESPESPESPGKMKSPMKVADPGIWKEVWDPKTQTSEHVQISDVEKGELVRGQRKGFKAGTHPKLTKDEIAMGVVAAGKGGEEQVYLTGQEGYDQMMQNFMKNPPPKKGGGKWTLPEFKKYMTTPTFHGGATEAEAEAYETFLTQIEEEKDTGVTEKQKALNLAAREGMAD